MINSLKRKLFALFCAASALCAAQSQEGLTVHHLGTNHSLIQVDEPQRYLLLPIEEAAPEATVNVLASGKIDQTFTARLAQNRVDYTVPFCLNRYEGRRVILDIHTENSRTNVRDTEADACWNALCLADTFDTANREPYRPLYHHSPLYGWMNDPNGMFYRDGTYHLYYQYNPYGSMWGNMNWGHSSTTDFIHWEHHPVAIEPNGLGMVFSGSSVVDKEGTAGFGKGAVVAIYTSAGASQMQSLAYSTDGGMTFHNYEGNPIITSDKECRDPNVFWHEESQRWILVLAAAQEREMWIYSSPDLKHWTKESSFGKGYGCQEGVWECPDLIRIAPLNPSKGGAEKWVLICNINPGGPFGGSGAQYFVGDFDGKRFTCDSRPDVTKWMDYGKDHYATVSWSNAPEGRHIVMAWMSNWQYANNVPTRQFRSSNSLPRELSLRKGDDGEYYLCTLPVPELEALRGKRSINHSPTNSPKGKALEVPLLGGLRGAVGAVEVDLEIDARSATKVHVTLSNGKGEQTVMTYDIEAQTFSMDRTRSGLTDFNKDFPAVTVAPAPSGTRQHLRLFIDRCSIEAFEGEGRFVMTNLVFPTEPYSTISLSADQGRCRVEKLTIYPINL